MRLSWLLMFSFLAMTTRSSSGSAGEKECQMHAGYLTGMMNNNNIVEASGLLLSRQHKGLLWTHNDKGDSARIFAFYYDGTDVGEFRLNDASHVDYEDITFGPGPLDNVDYIYLGDFGNNDFDRGYFVIYRFPEPSNLGKYEVDDVESFIILDPPPANFETLIYDPWTGDFFMLTRELYDEEDDEVKDRARLYRLQLTDPSRPTQLEYLGKLEEKDVRGGDISLDGSIIVLRSKKEAYQWRRQANESVEEALLSRKGCQLEVQGEQGEAAAMDNTRGFFVVNEGEDEILYQHFYVWEGQNQAS